MASTTLIPEQILSVRRQKTDEASPLLDRGRSAGGFLSRTFSLTSKRQPTIATKASAFNRLSDSLGETVARLHQESICNSK